MTIRIPLYTAALLMSVALEAAAQEPRTPNRGEDVRIQRVDGSRAEGTVALVNESTIVLWQRRKDPVEISAGSIKHMEVAVTGPQRGKGAGRGFLIGMAIGGGLGLLAGSGSSDGCCMNAEAAVVASALTLGTVGGIIGALAPPREWSSASLPTARVSPARLPQGPWGAVLSLSF